MRICIIWHRLGPQHIARAEAIAAGGALTVLEISAKDKTYEWDSTHGQSTGFERVTVFPEDDSYMLPPATVRREVWKALDKIRPDVLFVTGWGANFANAALDWAIHTKCHRVLFTDSAINDRPRTPIKEWIKAQIARNYRSAVVGGERHVKYVERLGIPRERVRLGYNCIDNAHFSAAAEAARSKPEEIRKVLDLPDRYWLCSCRFIAKKNLSGLLEAYAKYLACAGSIVVSPRLILLGDGPLKSDLQSLISSLNLQHRVMMPGFKQYQILASYYAFAEAFILPSTQEQWGLVVNEAMACGLPVLVSKQCNCSVELVVNGENGYTFDANDIDELAGVLEKMSNSSPVELARMGVSSRQIVSHFSLQAFAENVWLSAREAILDRSYDRPVFSRLILPLVSRIRSPLDI